MFFLYLNLNQKVIEIFVLIFFTFGSHHLLSSLLEDYDAIGYIRFIHWTKRRKKMIKHYNFLYEIGLLTCSKELFSSGVMCTPSN